MPFIVIIILKKEREKKGKKISKREKGEGGVKKNLNRLVFYCAKSIKFVIKFCYNRRQKSEVIKISLETFFFSQEIKTMSKFASPISVISIPIFK